MKMISLFILLLILSETALASYTVQNWFLKMGPDKLFGLRITERSRPLFLGNSIYFGSENGFFYSIRKNDGKINWKKKIEHGISGNPIVKGSRIYVGANDGIFYCMSVATGKTIWFYKVNYSSISTAEISKGIAYISGGDNAIYALDAKTGKWIWQYKRSFPKPLSVRGQSSPVFYKNYIYAGFSDGFFVKLGALDGKLIWERKLNDYHRFIDIDATARVDNRYVIVPAYDGRLYALNPGNGKTIWEYPFGGPNGVLMKGEKIYLPTGSGEIVVVSKKTGKRLWGFQGERGVSTTPVIRGNILLYGTSKSHLYAIDIRTRKKIWDFSTGSGISSSPHIDKNGNIFFISNYSNFYSIYVPDLKKYL